MFSITARRHRAHHDIWRVLTTIVVVLASLGAGSPPVHAADGIALVPVVSGLDAPVQVTNAGDGSERLFIVERPGRIRVVNGGELQEEPFLDLLGEHQARGVNFAAYQTLRSLVRGADGGLHCQLGSTQAYQGA